MKIKYVGELNNEKHFLFYDIGINLILERIQYKHNKYKHFLKIQNNILRQLKIDFIYNSTEYNFINWLSNKKNDYIASIFVTDNFHDFSYFKVEKLKDSSDMLVISEFFRGFINYNKHTMIFNDINFVIENLNLLENFYYYIQNQNKE